MQPLNLIFMGTPEFALPTLKSLIGAGHTITAVYTQPPRPAGRGHELRLSPVHAYALSRQITVHTPATLKHPDTLRHFNELKADAAIVAAYGLLLPQAILDGTRMGCINVHPSLLPRWRGAAPLQRTVMAGDKETAIVIMQMDAGLDTGDMLMVRRFSVDDMNAGALHDRLAAEAGPMVVETLDGLVSGTISRVKQPEEGVTYAKKITKAECRIDWKEPAETIRNKIRGLSPHPSAYFTYAGEAIKVLSAKTLEKPQHYERYAPGTILDESGRPIVCGEGLLAPGMVQRPGKKTMTYDDMLRGYPFPQGTVLQ
jgi:methionyl-tRNA formyltransferase